MSTSSSATRLCCELTCWLRLLSDGACPEEPACNAAGLALPNKQPCKPPAGRTDCACPWCGGPWVRNSSGPPGPAHLPGQGPLPPVTRSNMTEGDATQTGWTMVINNRKVFARGGNWVPVDLFFGRVTDTWLEQTVAMSAAANMNFYRIWGGGIIEKPAFFDACDRHGIMLLSEMAHMGPRPVEFGQSPITEQRGAQVLKGEAIDTTAAVFQQINHPSVVQWVSSLLPQPLICFPCASSILTTPRQSSSSSSSSACCLCLRWHLQTALVANMCCLRCIGICQRRVATTPYSMVS